MTRNQAWTVLGVVIMIAAAVGITWHVAQLAANVTVTPPIDLGVLPVVALLLVFPAFVAGQMRRGLSHGHGIIRSHFAAIKGTGLAVVLVAVAAVLVLGGAR